MTGFLLFQYLVNMAKKIKPVIIPPTPKMTKKALAEEKPLHIKMTFEEAIKKIVTMPVKFKKK